jgi:hemoglobin
MSELPVNSRRRPLHPSIDETLIERLVRRFYDKARMDRDLGPIFAAAIGDDWEPHLQKMYAFWSSVMCMTGRYHGRPVPVHRALSELRPEHFAIWLGLFGETACEVCEPDVAILFLERAERIAQSLNTAVFARLDNLRQPMVMPQ